MLISTSCDNGGVLYIFYRHYVRQTRNISARPKISIELLSYFFLFNIFHLFMLYTRDLCRPLWPEILLHFFLPTADWTASGSIQPPLTHYDQLYTQSTVVGK